MCTCDGESFLADQLDSLLRQTRPPDELVIVDDRSTDGTVSIAREYAARAPFQVRVEMNDPRLGIARNFERAIGLSSGDVVVLSDQDDVWLPRKMERVMAMFETSSNPGLVISNAQIVDDDLRPLGGDVLSYFSGDLLADPSSPMVFEHLIRSGNIFPGMTMAFASVQRALLLPFPSFVGDGRRGRWLHDGWISVALCGSAPFRVVKEITALYRQHPGQYLGVQGDGRPDDDPTTAFVDALTREIAIREEILMTLVGRAGQGGLRADALEYLAASIDHLRRRVEHRSATRRAPAVARELINGRYHRFSNGWRSAARDLTRKG